MWVRIPSGVPKFFTEERFLITDSKKLIFHIFSDYNWCEVYATSNNRHLAFKIDLLRKLLAILKLSFLSPMVFHDKN